ncbi:indole-3-glycerol phosphate synthase TrpC [Methanogenium organophilum]|uniref:indole-3-glycerol-phosphate synthase n=1 Tax=Methanogenium organophilum TaxID=2199 RepID=A0A9X9S5Y1_METOG|nr:indole-3-glycerol-phosphate synthase [Methanogenium organophilum]WAI02040.1 indole-3-glycerol-phosphate synthase [Methanogenium organophilum]
MILDDIVRNTALRIREPEESGEKMTPLSLKEAILSVQGRHAVIAEIKFSSPSAGKIRERTDPGKIAEEYQNGGCAAISVLTEPDYFGGRPDDIAVVKNAVSLPVLRKDFITDLRQIEETRALGADAVLLIAGLLGGRTGEFVSAARRAGLEPLVEVHTPAEAELARASGAELIGINNRDLRTMEVIRGTTAALAGPLRNAGRIVVSMSGIRGPEDIRRTAPHADAFLAGTVLMSADDPKMVLEELVCA